MMPRFKNSFPDPKLFDRYLADDASAEDRAVIDQWLTAHPDERELLVALEAGIRDSCDADAVPPYDVQRRIDAVVTHSIELERSHRAQASVSRSPGPRVEIAHGTTRSWGRWTTRSIARMALIIIAVVLSTVFVTDRGHHGQTTAFDDSDPPIVISTGPTHRTTVQFPDGSTVQLAPSSELRYTAAFGASTRNVSLDGEAVFTVVPHSAAPFTVYAHGTTTRVLGTTFGVRAYKSDTVIRVVVAEGRVSVGPAKVVEIGEVAYIDRRGGRVTMASVNVTELLGWTRGKLVFTDMPFGSLVQELERWYGLTITIDNPQLAQRLVTAHFEQIETTVVLDILARSLGIRYERNGQQVRFLTQ